MTHRRIRDRAGEMWDVWEVYPSAVERRMSGEVPAVLDEGVERRVRREVRVVVPEGLQQGWLAFQNGDERRRLAPIPDEWSTLADAELVALLEKADRTSEPK